MRLGGLARSGGGALTMFGGATLTVGGGASCVVTVGGGCVVAAGGTALTYLGYTEARDGIGQLFGDYESQIGQEVLASFTADTHLNNGSPLEDLAWGSAKLAGEFALAKVGGRYVESSLEKWRNSRADGENPSVQSEQVVDVPPTGEVVPKGGAFASDAKLLNHFEAHGAEFGARSADEYLQVGRDIMQSGQKVEYLYKGETRTGYVKFMGNTSRGDAKFGFVGTNADGAITTIHTQSGNSFWKLLNGNPADKTIRPVP